jgi:hypothetical protein
MLSIAMVTLELLPARDGTRLRSDADDLVRRAADGGRQQEWTRAALNNLAGWFFRAAYRR